MEYADQDLSCFVPIADLTLLKGTAYFELHQGELPSENKCWLEGSLFIHEEAFIFFEGCFQNSMAGFSYFAFNRATPAEVATLHEEIASFLKTLDGAEKREVIFSRAYSRNVIGFWDRTQTDSLRSAVLTCGRAIQEYILDTKRNGVALHVLGM